MQTIPNQTLEITERTWRTVVVSRSSGTEIMKEDRRGKDGKPKKMDEEVVFKIVSMEIARVESHFARNNTTEEFMDGGITSAL